MIHKLIVVISIALQVFGRNDAPGTDEYLLQALAPVLNPLNEMLFDGPASISNAHTKNTNRNKLPTLEQMRYYNYVAASMYYGYDHHDLSCEYCLRYRDDIDDHEVIPNDVHNTLALVMLSKTRKEIIVGFRGSWNIWNYVLDVLLISGREGKSSKQIKVHKGFYIATMSLYNDVVNTVTKYLNVNPGFKVVITGHSLGGAIARLTYFFLEDNKQFPTVTYELYTYGELRVGNKHFAEFMNSRPITTARVVNRADIFTHIPMTSVLGSKLLGDHYVHPQTEFWINGKPKNQFCRRIFYEDPRCSMSMGPAYSYFDHLAYFDANLGSVLGQPLIFADLPLNIMNSVKVLPPLPKPIEHLVGGVSKGVLGALVPTLG